MVKYPERKKKYEAHKAAQDSFHEDNRASHPDGLKFEVGDKLTTYTGSCRVVGEEVFYKARYPLVEWDELPTDYLDRSIPMPSPSRLYPWEYAGKGGLVKEVVVPEGNYHDRSNEIGNTPSAATRGN